MKDKINVLKLTIHERLVGYLAGFQSGRNALIFADEFKSDAHRPTFSLITQPAFPRSDKLMAEPWTKNQRLHPTLSNLLPEGSLREFITQSLKVHIENEFHILSYLGKDLPGALVAAPMTPNEVPERVLAILSGKTHENPEVINFAELHQENKFSLAGVQMKFSMKKNGDRYNLSQTGALGDWIIKPPSTRHKDVPLNEYTAMTLASLVGIDIPEIKLVNLEKLDNLPQINLPQESKAFAIKRFDRENNSRIHMEDFAQVLVKYPHEKYNSANYQQIGKILYQYSGDGLVDSQQFARRLLVNILLANGDAHLKNWSLLYADKLVPRLSPAYDIVTTSVYIDNEQYSALNFGKTNDWYKASYANFQYWAEKSDIPWRAIKPHLDDVLDKAKTLWRKALNDLPMNNEHKQKLSEHWGNLHKDFKI